MAIFKNALNKFKKLPLLIKIIIVVLFLGLGYFTFTKFFTKKTAAVQYQTDVVATGTLVNTVTASGSVTATNSRTVTTTASGVVQKVFLKEGQKVSTGTPILQITLDMDGQQQMQSAYASLLSAQNNLQSAKDKLYSLQSSLTNAQNIFVNQWSAQSPDDATYIQTHNNYLSAQAAFTNQQAVINQAQASLNNARLSYQLASPTVYAPITGTVSAISLTPGMILNPTSSSANSTNSSNKIAIVVTDATPAIAVSLTEIDVSKVKVGNQATVTLDAFPGKTFTGKVIAVDTSGSVSSGVVSYTTTIQFDDNTPGILSNMTASANIITNVETDVTLIPASAVQTNATTGETTVRQLKNNQLISLPITIGNSNSTQTIVLSGLNVGDTIVTSVITPSASTPASSGASVFSGSRNFGGAGNVVRVGAGGAARGN